MKDILKWGLILGGGYFAVKSYLPGLFGSTTTAGAPSAPVDPAVIPPPATPPPVDTSLATVAAVKAEAARRGYQNSLTPDQWNWMYSTIKGGAPAPDPTILSSDDRSIPITAEVWMQRIRSKPAYAGFSGMGNYLDLRGARLVRR